jgi:hypothetical protein
MESKLQDGLKDFAVLCTPKLEFQHPNAFDSLCSVGIVSAHMLFNHK